MRLTYLERREIDTLLLKNRTLIESGNFTVKELSDQLSWKQSPNQILRYCKQLGIKYKIKIVRAEKTKPEVKDTSNPRVSRALCILAREIESLQAKLGEAPSKQFNELMYDVKFSEEVRKSD